MWRTFRIEEIAIMPLVLLANIGPFAQISIPKNPCPPKGAECRQKKRYTQSPHYSFPTETLQVALLLLPMHKCIVNPIGHPKSTCTKAPFVGGASDSVNCWWTSTTPYVFGVAIQPIERVRRQTIDVDPPRVSDPRLILSPVKSPQSLPVHRQLASRQR